MIEKFQGIFPAVATAYDENDNVDSQIQADLSRWLIEQGCKGLFVCGGTGESVLLSTEERKTVIEATMDAVGGEATVIAHIGSQSPKEAYELAEHAAGLDVDAIAAIPGTYFLPDETELLKHYRRLGEIAQRPVFLYHIPTTTHLDMSIEQFRKLAEIPRVSGMKYTDTDLFKMQQVRADLGEDFAILAGSDQLMAPALLMGATGAVGTGYNYMFSIYTEAFEAAAAGDYQRAAEYQRAGNDIIRTQLGYSSIDLCKLALREMGFAVGPARAPLAEAPPEVRERFLDKLREHNILT
ncbi:MAG: dihydrodipicolinate synthase family protein [Armatimonadota bacterium]